MRKEARSKRERKEEEKRFISKKKKNRHITFWRFLARDAFTVLGFGCLVVEVPAYVFTATPAALYPARPTVTAKKRYCDPKTDQRPI